MDWNRLAEVVRDAVHFLDNVIDVNKFPLPEIAEKAQRDRRIGLGVMGWAEMLVQLMLPYDSEEAVVMGRKVMSFIKKKAVEASAELAAQRGVYPEWEGSQWQRLGIQVRNATITTVAPTGTISIIAASPDMPCSGGIEPKFALVFTRNQADSLMIDVDGQFAAIARSEGWYSDELMQEIARRGTARGVAGVPEKWQRIFATSHDIAPEWHVRMQAAFQGEDELNALEQPVCAAVSKTVNFPHHATVEDVERVYRLAWDLGLKGITVYRDGSRHGQVLSIGTAAKSGADASRNEEGSAGDRAATGAAPKAPAAAREWKKQPLRPRPEVATGIAINLPTHFGKLSADFHIKDGEVFEAFFNVGAAGSDLMADAVGMGMLISVILRLEDGVPVDQRLQIIREKLSNIGGSGSYGFGPNRVTSLPSAIARAIERLEPYLSAIRAHKDSAALETLVTEAVKQAAAGAEGAMASPAEPQSASPGTSGYARTGDICPSCGNYSLYKYGGCEQCFTPGCNYNRCT